MNRGDIHWYIGPPTASETVPKKRPVIIVSHDEANSNPSYPYITVVPVTSKVHRIYRIEVDLEDTLHRPSKAQPQAIFTCRKDVLEPEPIAALDNDLMFNIDRQLHQYLDLFGSSLN